MSLGRKIIERLKRFVEKPERPKRITLTVCDWVRPACPCGGFVRYFGEGLMGSLKCDDCGDYLFGVGEDLQLRERWNSGERGRIQDDAAPSELN